MIWPASMILGQRKDRCKPETSGETRTFGSTGLAWTRLWTCSRSPWPTSRPCLGAAYQLWPFSAWLLLFKCLTSPTRFEPRTFWSWSMRLDFKFENLKDPHVHVQLCYGTLLVERICAQAQCSGHWTSLLHLKYSIYLIVLEIFIFK